MDIIEQVDEEDDILPIADIEELFRARAEREAFFTQFRSWRDEYFEPIPNSTLRVQDTAGDIVTLDDPETNDMEVVYQLKDEDDSLAMATKSLVMFRSHNREYEYYEDSDLFVMLRLNGGALFLVTWDDVGFSVHDIVINDETYIETGLEFDVSHGTVRATLFLPIDTLDAARRKMDCDCMFSFITSAAKLERVSSTIRIISSREPLNASDFLNTSSFCDSLRLITWDHMELVLDRIGLNEEHWLILQPLPCKAIEFMNVFVPEMFWRNTRARHVTFDCYEGLNAPPWRKDAIDVALSGLRMRQTPIKKVSIDGDIILRSNEEAIAFRDILCRVKHLSVAGMFTSSSAWAHLWLSSVMQSNCVLRSLCIQYHFDVSDPGDLRDMPWSSMKHAIEIMGECLEKNRFIHTIRLPTRLLELAGMSRFWRKHVDRRLKLNRFHLVKLAPADDCLSAVHDELMYVRSHPSKLRNLLCNHPTALTAMTTEDRLLKVTQSRDELREAMAMLRYENRVQRDQIDSMKRTVKVLRLKNEWLSVAR